MTEKEKKCPKCGGDEFLVAVHITQDWKVDCNGNFLEVICDCIDVTRFPDDDDMWGCAKCGYSAGGSKFNMKGANQ